jgi:hypothetical protein
MMLSTSPAFEKYREGGKNIQYCSCIQNIIEQVNVIKWPAVE